MLEPGSAGDILSGNIEIYKGAIYENIIADAFSKMDRDLCYYRRESELEIDFIMKYKGKVTLVEVKSRNSKAKAANHILSSPEYKVDMCIKLGECNVGLNNRIMTIPHYMAFLLKE